MQTSRVRTNIMKMRCIKAMALLTAFLSLLGLSGCDKKEKFPADPAAVPVSAAFSCNSMSRSDCYSFALYQKNETTVLDADFYSYETDVRYTYVKVAADGDFERMLGLIEEYDLVTYVGKYKPKKTKIQVADGTDYYLSLAMSDGSHKTASPSNDARNALYDFFTEITVATAENPDWAQTD